MAKTEIKRISNFSQHGIEVVNLAHCKDWGKDGDFIVDRRSRYGNGFRMENASDAERDRVCDQYVIWLVERLDKDPNFLLPILDAKRLGCWCAPKRCHAESIARAIIGMRRTQG